MIYKNDVTSIVVQFLQSDGRKRKRFILKHPINRGDFVEWKMKNETRKGIFSISGFVGYSNSSI